MAGVNEPNLLSKLENKIKKQFVQFEKELNSLNDQVIKIEKRKTKLIQLLADEVITQMEYRDAVTQDEENLKQLLLTRLELESKLSSTDNSEQIQQLRKELSKFTKINDLTPELLHRLIERIEIKADGTARIFYRFSLPSAII